MCEDTCDTAALVVSELVTNAVVHTASSHIVCELHDRGDLVRIAVRDEGCAPGQPRANTRRQPEEEHGRGLLLVDALCQSWGSHEQGPGLLVWADLPRTADTGDAPARPTDDLGWGTRPKPGPPGAPDDDSADEPEQSRRPVHAPALPRSSARRTSGAGRDERDRHSGAEPGLAGADGARAACRPCAPAAACSRGDDRADGV
ncbi:hypothetical protein SHKM778_69840 [Streptomyces sp. KM77-8]|uniref:Histidine kinase/HSP90-like ATPase domain-containing protein n=1 Tax=Streptomyces haneummycinicus TaxID=3074435 RepID=A0AAT9HTI9_9ACTN